jgi:NTP pyrophosphatase (non-canonical NTP hydrolase)
MINDLADRIHTRNVQKGFYDDEKNIGEMLCLIHSEVSEALEADRKNSFAVDIKRVNGLVGNDDEFKRSFNENIKDTFEDELADIFIRVLDLAAHKGIDLEQHIAAKMRYNYLRPHKHGKNY